ncbi:hypothetical protein D3C84_1308450 [compost metagenome]
MLEGKPAQHAGVDDEMEDIHGRRSLLGGGREVLLGQPEFSRVKKEILYVSIRPTHLA